jgi:hypothetical protein
MSVAILQTIDRIEAALVAANVPPLSPYWRAELTRFYLHPTARVLVEMVGRGGDKSRTSVIMAIAETLAGEHRIFAGERHYYTHISENLTEAGKTLRILKSYLEILRVPFTATGETIDLDAMPKGFKVLASRTGAVSGWRSYGWTADECAKWASDGVDPAKEIIASIKAMTITHPTARGRMISSPMGKVGHFYDQWAAGDTAQQLTGHAASWEANPGAITEAFSHELEPDEPTWRREYAAIPSEGGAGAFGADAVNAMIRPLREGSQVIGNGVLLIDSSAGKNDAWSYAFANYVQEPPAEHYYLERDIFDERGVRTMTVNVHDPVTGLPVPNPRYAVPKPTLRVYWMGAFEGAFGTAKDFDAVVGETAYLAGRSGVHRAVGDQYQAYPLRSAYERRGMAFEDYPWTAPTKIEAAATLRRLLSERALQIDPGPQSELLRQELGAIEEQFTPGGALTIGSRRTRKGHSDRAWLLLLLARLESEGAVSGSPTARDLSRREVPTHSFNY